MTRIRLPEMPGHSDKSLQRIPPGVWRLIDDSGNAIRHLNQHESRLVDAAFGRRCEQHAEEVKRLTAMVVDRDWENAKLRDGAAQSLASLDRAVNVLRKAVKRDMSHQWRWGLFWGVLAAFVGSRLGVLLDLL